MNQAEIVQSLREEIRTLQQVLDLLLVRPNEDAVPTRGPGRPKGSGSRATSFNPAEFAPKRRTMSAEGKARIAAAQKKRWAKQKRAASAKVSTASEAQPKQPVKVTSLKGAKKRPGRALSAGAAKSPKPAEVASKKAVAKAAKQPAVKQAPDGPTLTE